MGNHENLFEPIKIGKVTIKNRYALAPMLFVHEYEDGAFGERAIEYYLERAKGGVGVLFTSLCKVDNDVENVNLGMPMPNQNPELFTKRLKKLTTAMAEYDSKLFVQLTAGFGRAVFPIVTTSEQSYVAPSVISNRWDPEKQQRALSIDEIHEIIRKFGTAAKIAQDGGAAGVEIHALHEGYLLDQFSMSFYNQRTDEYGGSLENRLRFTKEIIDEIHRVCGEDFPVGMRLSLKSFVKDLRKGILPEETKITLEKPDVLESGRDFAEGLEVAKMLESYGYAHLSVDGGNYDSWYWAHPPLFFEQGPYLPLSEEVKKVVNIPVIVSGMMANPDFAEQALSENKLDMVALGRPLIADSQIVNKIYAGNYEDITPCQYCHEGCFNQVNHRNAHCTVNARAGRECEFPLETEKTTNVKEIAIIGAGPAGLEAGRLLAAKGHQVTIYEKSDKIGGLFSYGVVPEFKEAGVRLVQWWGRQLSQLGVKIEFHTAITAEDTRLAQADEIIVATGSYDFIPPVTGIDLPNVTIAKDFLTAGAENAGELTTIIGGGTVGVEIAIWLAKHGKKSQIIEMADTVLPKGAPHPNWQMMLELLDFHKVARYTSARLTKINPDSIEVEQNGENKTLPASQVVLALGYRSEKTLYEALKEEYPHVTNLGDSNQVRDVLEAVNDAFALAQTL
ncbi:FAD-dependent oxidoreductase [Lactococcus nasutitermitis]|uniref:FAD-dependent oxidoreductase n=1 Tax=Lactococcus nasutitermitis TaxID=1652957 RepID=A0ABV9JFZ0_9LACT|nr:FAD-dependent oxidoreductase [Lactococcus nasutitermitis]